MGTRRLTLLRHGQAQPAEVAPEDFERALTRHGVSEAKEMASRIVRRGLIPDLILASPAERAWTTAGLVASACELDSKQVRCARELYLAAPESIWRLVTRLDASIAHVLICAHNPGLSQLAGRLGPTLQPRDLPTAGLVTAVWAAADWATLEPEIAVSCDMDDPENLTDLWV